MKKALTIVLALLYYCCSFAQQDAQYTQYMFNNIVRNPAYTGTRQAVSALAIYRHQWAGLDGAPRTFSASVHSPVGSSMGLGLYVENDVIGVHNRLSVYGSYAYRIFIDDRSRLSIGLQAGILNYRSDWSQLGPLQDAGDMSFDPSQVYNKLLPNFGLGLYYYIDDLFYVGFSAPHLLDSSLDNVQQVSNYDRHYFLSAGYVLDIADNVRFKPTILVKSVPAYAPFEFDINANFLLFEQLWLGIGYQTEMSIPFVAQYQFENGLRVGYAYDLGLSQLNNYHSGSHEIMLGFDFDSRKPEKIISPRFFGHMF